MHASPDAETRGEKKAKHVCRPMYWLISTWKQPTFTTDRRSNTETHIDILSPDHDLGLF